MGSRGGDHFVLIQSLGSKDMEVHQSISKQESYRLIVARGSSLRCKDELKFLSANPIYQEIVNFPTYVTGCLQHGY